MLDDAAAEATSKKFAYSSRESGLHQQLSAGQMAMVGVGGSIGTGLLLGSGAAVQIAGPSVILSFIFAALITWTVTTAMGEMASVHPAAGSFGVYAEMYLNSWAGFVSRYAYWFAIAIAIGGEMVASATYMHLWFPSVKDIGWVIVFAVILVGVNVRNVAAYGRFEYWFAMVKLVTIVAFIGIGSVLLLRHHVVPQYLPHGGFFPNGFAAPVKAMSFSLFTFAGIEMVAISSGESRSVSAIRRAVRLAFSLLVVVYVGAIIVLIGVMPWNRAGTAQSPFVAVFRQVGLPAASHVMNVVVLTAALSGANASLYADSRTLFSLAREGYAPRVLGKLTSAGAPLPALLLSSCGVILALVMEAWAPRDAFVFLLGAALFGAMISWLVTLAAHVRFRMTNDKQTALSKRSSGGSTTSVVGFLAISASLVATWWYSHVTVISGLIYVAVLSGSYLFVRRRRGEPLESHRP